MTYWIAVENPPEQLVDAWEALHEAFGTEPFSKSQGLAVLEEKYPGLARTNVIRILDGFVEIGCLGVEERET